MALPETIAPYAARYWKREYRLALWMDELELIRQDGLHGNVKLYPETIATIMAASEWFDSLSRDARVVWYGWAQAPLVHSDTFSMAVVSREKLALRTIVARQNLKNRRKK